MQKCFSIKSRAGECRGWGIPIMRTTRRRNKPCGAEAQQSASAELDRADTTMVEGQRLVEDCALCIVGAGYAGLNALAAAVDYLAPNDRVVILDRNTTWGGQFIDQYGFVKLHQPYRAFTPGASDWALIKPREHLASHKEILCHLEDVAQRLSTRVQLTTLFGYSYDGHTSVEGAVELTACSTDGPAIRIRAERLVVAVGFDVPLLGPLRLRSPDVRSVSVRDARLASTAMAYDSSPVYIIGSGKTAMDVAHLLVSSARQRAVHAPRKQIVMIAGSGTWFINRDATFPVGARRWWAGRSGFYDLLFELLVGIATGRADVDSLRAAGARGALHSLSPAWAKKCRAGILSEAELALVREGLTEVLEGHLVDVVPADERAEDGRAEDGRARPTLVYTCAEGTVRRPIEAGAWVVNCTSHMTRTSYEPVLSDGGRVLSTQTCLIFSGPSAFLFTHLFYRAGAGAAAWARLRLVRPSEVFRARYALAGLHNLVCACLELPPWTILRCKAITLMFFWHAWHVNGVLLIRLAASLLPYMGRLYSALEQIPTYCSAAHDGTSKSK